MTCAAAADTRVKNVSDRISRQWEDNAHDLARSVS